MTTRRTRLRGILLAAVVVAVGLVTRPAVAAADGPTYKLAVVAVASGIDPTQEELDALRESAFGAVDSAASRFARVGVTLTGDVLGPVRIAAINNDRCTFSSYASAALRALSAAGIATAGYRFVSFRIFRPAGSCYMFDRGELGGRLTVLGSTSSHTLVHELGHTLGFMHANGLRCSGARDYRLRTSRGCRAYEYEDSYSVMGAGFVMNGEEAGEAITIDAWRAYGLAPAVIGAPAKFAPRYGTMRLSTLDDRRGLAPHWATMTLPSKWRLSLELSPGRGGEYCADETPDRNGDTTVTQWGWLSCGPAVVLRLIPPGRPFGIGKGSYLVRAIGLGSAFHDAKRNWSVKFSSFDDGVATISIWDATKPLAPGAASASPSADYSSVVVTWGPPAAVEPGLTYDIAYSWGAGSTRILGSTADTTWSTTDAFDGGSFYVRSVDPGGNASAWVPVTVVLPPTPDPIVDPVDPGLGG